jgi:hypothetical protein
MSLKKLETNLYHEFLHCFVELSVYLLRNTPMSPDPYAILFIKDRTQTSWRCAPQLYRHTPTYKVTTNYGVFLSGRYPDLLWEAVEESLELHRVQG